MVTAATDIWPTTVTADLWLVESSPSDRSKTTTAGQKGDVLRVGAPAEALENGLLGLWSPEDLQAFTCPGDGRAEDVVDHRPEPLGLVEQDRVADLVCGDAPGCRSTGVAALEEPVDVVDAVEAVIVQAQDDLVIALSLEQRLVEHGGRC